MRLAPCFNLARLIPACTLLVALLATPLAALAESPQVRLEAGKLHLTLDSKGTIVHLSGADARNRLDPKRPSSLLMLQAHGETALRHPVSLREEAFPNGSKRLIFGYEGGRSATVEVTPRGGYLRMKLVKAEPLASVARISWGPLNTAMKDSLAEYLGLIRDGDFTLGMLSLEPNTDGVNTDGGHYHVAKFNGTEGSFLQALANDHTRTGPGEAGYYAYGVPGVTVEGSAIALFGCGRKAELDAVEAVSKGENLPRPTIGGVWNKRSQAHFVPALWVHYDKSNLGDYLAMAKLFGSNSICNVHDTFANWGHFEPNPQLYPGGVDDLRQTVKRCHTVGVDHIMYTLSTFLRPHTRPEPYLTPTVHPEFQHLLPRGSLAANLDANSDHLTLRDEPGLRGVLAGHLRIDGEMILCGKVEVRENLIHLTGCGRGAMGTNKVAHAAGTPVARLPQHFMNSFCPGTLKFQDDVADRIARVARESGFPQITLDGYESCLRTGHGAYAKNRFAKRIFDQARNLELRFTPSNFGNYDWHLMSYVSWGEFDQIKGFRGTMLDYRLRRQLQLESNHMPHKMGQYYPDNATPEDMHWLMAVAAGWNAGVDMHFTKASPNSENIRKFGEIVRLWMDARRTNVFTSAQKLSLRQTDRLHTLTRDAAGNYQLELKGRWTHPGVQPIRPSAFAISPQDPARVDPCGIDWSWTHNPGIYRKAGLSDDMVTVADGKTAEWKVTYPGKDRFHFVLRISADAPAAIRNPVISLNGTNLVIPAVLQPGQYLSTTHDMSRVSIYDKNHEVIGEADIQCLPYRLPAIEGGKEHRIGLSAESVDPLKGPVPLRLNLRAHVTFGEDI